jgi:hypothetical protein
LNRIEASGEVGGAQQSWLSSLLSMPGAVIGAVAATMHGSESKPSTPSQSRRGLFGHVEL